MIKLMVEVNKMIDIDNKLKIVNILKTLEKDIQNSIEKTEDSFGLESIYIWNAYNKYLFSICAQFDLSKNLEIFSELKLDEIHVHAKGNYAEEKGKMLSYIDEIIEKLQLNK